MKWALFLAGRLSDVESFGRATKALQNGGSLNRYGCLVSLPELLNTEGNCMNCVCSLKISQKSTVHDKVFFLQTKTRHPSKKTPHNKRVHKKALCDKCSAFCAYKGALAGIAKSSEET